MLKIPYGESDFSGVIQGNFFYQDRTKYIQDVEQSGSKFIFYLRPRRFGKSLFISMLHHYYALEAQKDFHKLFDHLDIGKNPTPFANQYMVLSFEFSGIQTNTPESTFKGFLRKVQHAVRIFLGAYRNFFPQDIHNDIIHQSSPDAMIDSLFFYYKKISQTEILPKIYILIDEYDHFTNELIAFDFKTFIDSVTQNGFVRKFYETIKTATRDSIVDRLFVTGVSPITLDSMTSGFNIGLNISLFKEFHGMMGFEEKEVQGILKGIGVKRKDLARVAHDLRAWYDGYLFHAEAKHVYNPDMVLFFALQYQLSKQYPDDLLDPNIATDYGKIRKLFKIQGREAEQLAVLDTLTEMGDITARLTIQFSLEKKFTADDLVSLLFYMGFLTIKEREIGGFIFKFPNYVIERLYSSYFVDMLQEQKGLPIDNSKLNYALRAIAKIGDPQFFYAEVIKIVKALSTRDTQGFTENTLKAIFVSLLQQQQFYYVHSEYESERQYVDVFLETILGHPVKFEMAFELKYVKKGENIDTEKELAKASVQLTNYMVSKKFILRPNVKAFVVLVHGAELHTRAVSLA